MSGDDLMFDEFITLCDEQYEYGLIEFKNGDVVNKPGENDGSAKVLSYAALADFDKDMTLKVCCCLRLCFVAIWVSAAFVIQEFSIVTNAQPF